MIDTQWGEARLLDFVPDKKLPAATLLELTGDVSKADPSHFPSGLVRRVAKTWVTPLTDLTCGQYRMLVRQRFGLLPQRPRSSRATRSHSAICTPVIFPSMR
jgi:hypothetical protein